MECQEEKHGRCWWCELGRECQSRSVKLLKAEYDRIAGVAATEQQRFGFSARPDFMRLAKAGADMNAARKAWLDEERKLHDTETGDR